MACKVEPDETVVKSEPESEDDEKEEENIRGQQILRKFEARQRMIQREMEKQEISAEEENRRRQQILRNFEARQQRIQRELEKKEEPEEEESGRLEQIVLNFEAREKPETEEEILKRKERNAKSVERCREWRTNINEEQGQLRNEKQRLRNQRRKEKHKELKEEFEEWEVEDKEEILRKERNAKSGERWRIWRAKMTEEQRKLRNEKQRLRNQKRREKNKELAEKDKELLQKDNETRRKRKPQDKEKRRHRYQMLIAEVGPEEWKNRCKKRAQRERERKANLSEDEKFRLRMKQYLYVKAKISCMSQEEREESKRKNRENVRKWYQNMTPEQKEKWLEKMRLRAKMISLKNPGSKLKPEAYMKTVEYQRERIANETPDQRQKRLYRFKVNAAQRKLRKELEKEGSLSKEDIEERVKKLREEMWSVPLPPPKEEELSQYKPRLSGRKPKNDRTRKLYIAASSATTKAPPSRQITTTLASESNMLESRIVERTSTQIPALSSSSQPPLEIQQCPGEVNQHLPSPLEAPFTQVPSLSSQPPLEIQQCPDEVNQYSSSPLEEDSVDQYSNILDNDNFDQDVTFDDPQTENCEFSDAEFPEDSGPSSILCVWKCPQPRCSEAFENPSTLSVHYEMMHEKPFDKFKYLCMRCPWKTNETNERCRFRCHSSLRRHVQHFHPYNYWPCPICNLLLYSESRYKGHVSTCSASLQIKKTKENVLFCEECGKLFSRLERYQSHKLSSHHPNKEKFTCPYCQYSCSYAVQFWVHFTTCAKPLPEIGIPYKSVIKPNLSSSENRYKGKGNSGPVSCEQCGKTFTQRCTLDDHVRREHEGIEYVCSECKRNFQSAGKLWRHQAEVHKMTDLPAPPGVEIMRCMYCNDFVMRGYEFHVKKKHPESLDEFRQNVLPVVKEKLKQVVRQNPKLLFKGSHKDFVITKSVSSGKSVAFCKICKVELPRSNINKHIAEQHGKVNIPQKDTDCAQCAECGNMYANRKNMLRHYAMMHAYRDLNEKLIKGKLMEFRCVKTKKIARCLLCNQDMPRERFTIGCHFVACHFEMMHETYEKLTQNV